MVWKYNEIYSHSHMELGKNFDGGWSINSNIKLEGGPDGDSHVHGGYRAPNGEDHGINDHMLVLEELKLNYDSKKLKLTGNAIHMKTLGGNVSGDITLNEDGEHDLVLKSNLE